MTPLPFPTPRRRTLAGLLLALPLAALPVGAQDRPEVLGPCTLPGVPAPVQCGTLAVPEDRTGAGEATIDLRIVRLGATGEDPAPEPLFILVGGPGEAAAGAAPGMGARLRELRRDRDIVLFDQRGTGESNGLDCSFYGGDLDGAFGDLLPEESIRACVTELEERVDLRHYTTENHADDLDKVRDALGYDRVDLWGTSYGTRAALTYIRRYEDRVRSAVLHGVHPPGVRALPAFAPAAQAALEGVLAECAADEGCARAFPAIRQEAGEVFQRLREAPARVPVLDPDSGEPAEIALTATVAGEAVRYMLYRPGWADMLPVVLHQAHRGDLSGLAEFAVFARLRMIDGPGSGLWVAITCQEEAEDLDLDEAARLARDGVFDDHRARSFHRACAVWPHDPVDRGFHAPVRSPVPALLLSGEHDPATPASQGERAARDLPNALHLVVPSGGHAFDGLEGAGCVDEVIAAFLAAGTAEGLDTGCVEEIRRPPFRTEPLLLTPTTVAAERLAALTGRYVGVEVPLEIGIEAEDGRLRATLPDGESLVLVPVAGEDLRFRPPGLPGFYLVAGEGEDGLARLWLEEPGAPPLELERR